MASLHPTRIGPLAAAELQEARRIDAIRRWRVLDAPPDSFTQFTTLAAQIFDVPFGTVCIVHQDRVWFRDSYGLGAVGGAVESIPRSPGLCCSVVETGDPLLMPDARLDEVSSHHPLVAGDFGLRFYAGAPLRTSDNYHLGTLSVFDRSPRPVADGDQEVLVALAGLVVREFEVRLAAQVEVSVEKEESEALRSQTENLQTALGSHGSIGQAMGILMAERGYTSEVAFETLRRVSQNRNVKLADVARNLVEDFDLRARIRRARSSS